MTTARIVNDGSNEETKAAVLLPPSAPMKRRDLYRRGEFGGTKPVRRKLDFNVIGDVDNVVDDKLEGTVT